MNAAGNGIHVERFHSVIGADPNGTGNRFHVQFIHRAAGLEAHAAGNCLHICMTGEQITFNTAGNRFNIQLFRGDAIQINAGGNAGDIQLSGHEISGSQAR